MRACAVDDGGVDSKSDDFVIGRLRRRAFGGNLVISAGGATPEASDRGAVRFKIADVRRRFEIAV